MKSLLVVLLCARVASAEDRARSEEYFRAGEQAYRAQNFAAAASDFDESYKAFALPEIAFSAAQAYRRQYRIDPKPEYVVRAVKMYRAYLDKVKTGGRVADASDALDNMQRELDKLIKEGIKVGDELAAEHTQLDVSVSLAGTVTPAGGVHEIEDSQPATSGDIRVTIDGQPVQPFAPVNVTPAKHAVHVEAPGYFPHDTEAIAVQGISTLVPVVLEPKPGRIAITTARDAKLTVDGREVGNAPRGAVDVPAGRHLITIQLRGHEPVVREVVVDNDREIAVDAPLTRTSRRRAVPYVLGGAGVLAFASGTTALVAYFVQRDAQEILDRTRSIGNVAPSDTATYADDRARRDSFATAAWITGGAALATAAVGLALYRFDEPSPAVRIAPTFGGAAVVGRY